MKLAGVVAGVAIGAVGFWLVTSDAVADWIRSTPAIHIATPVVGYFIGQSIYIRLAEKYNWGPYAGLKIWLGTLAVLVVLILLFG